MLEKAGTRRVDLTEFAGKDILVFRRNTGFLSGDEFTNLSTGGFELTDENDLFNLGEKFFVFNAVSNQLAAPAFSEGLIRQYPHILTGTIAGEATKDGNGDNIPGEPTEVIVQCRHEPASGEGFVSGPDGTKINYAAKVYFPLGTDRIPTGTMVEITDSDYVISKDSIKLFSKGQLNCRAWL